jgi:DNA mismatch repair ATPase MutL
VLDYFSDLFTSDIRIEDLDNQLRIWVSQFVENSFESKATSVEVRFLKMGSDGFDVIDNGEGIPESDFLTLAKTLPNREKNDMYKTRSLGY